MNSKDILRKPRKPQKKKVESTDLTPVKVAVEERRSLTVAEKKSLQKPYVAGEVKDVADELGMDLRYILSLVKEQAESTITVMEPLKVPLLDEFNQPIYEEIVLPNGSITKVPLMTEKKMVDPDTQRVKTITVARTIPNLKARQWAVEMLKDLLIQPSPKETNLNVGVAPATLSEMERIHRMFDENPELEDSIRRAVSPNVKDAEFEIIPEITPIS